MKNKFQIFCVIILVLPYFYIPTVQGKTVGDLKKELEKMQENLSKNNNEQSLTEQQIANTNNSINKTKADIQATFADIEALNKEVEKLDQEIIEKDKEMKEIMNFIQISNGESAYMEYIFGAQNFTDFIYRMAISEQLTNYNNKLIKECNEMIKSINNKKQQLENKRVELGKQQTSLAEKSESLGKKLEILTDTSIDIKDEIKYQKEIVSLYVSKGCKDNEDISTCGRKTLPQGTAFYRPMVSGWVTSNWGPRGGGWHEGIDMTNPVYGVDVFAIATGMVVTIFNRHECGGNMVVVHHNIKGKNYTSVYVHLKSISVKIGQTVDRNTLIGSMGGGRETEVYDTCTFGAHLHLTVATGLYGIDYDFKAMNYRYSVNPRSVINFPNGIGRGNSFSDRLSQY